MAVLATFTVLGQSIDHTLIGTGPGSPTVGSLAPGGPPAPLPESDPPSPTGWHPSSTGEGPSVEYGGGGLGGDEEGPPSGTTTTTVPPSTTTTTAPPGTTTGGPPSGTTTTTSPGTTGADGSGDPTTGTSSASTAGDGSPAGHARALEGALGDGLDEGDLEHIAGDEGRSATEREAAQFFLDNPAYRHVLERGGEGGDDNGTIGRDDLRTGIAALEALDAHGPATGTGGDMSRDQAENALDHYGPLSDIAAGRGEIDGGWSDDDARALLENRDLPPDLYRAAAVIAFGEEDGNRFAAARDPFLLGSIPRDGLELVRSLGTIFDLVEGQRAESRVDSGDSSIVTGSIEVDGQRYEYGAHFYRDEDGNVERVNVWLRNPDGTMLSADVDTNDRPSFSAADSSAVLDRLIYTDANGVQVALVADEEVVVSLPDVPDGPEESCGYDPLCHGGRFLSGAGDRVVDEVKGIGTFLAVVQLAGAEAIYGLHQLATGDFMGEDGSLLTPDGGRDNPYVPTVDEMLGTGQFNEMLRDGIIQMPGAIVTGVRDDVVALFRPSSSAEERGYAFVGVCEVFCTLGYGAVKQIRPRGAMLDELVSVRAPSAIVDRPPVTPTVPLPAEHGVPTFVARDEVFDGTAIPKGGTLRLANGDDVFVTANALEHVADVGRNATGPHVGWVREQEMQSLLDAVAHAGEDGIPPYGEVIHIDGWELIFGPPRNPGDLPALIHANQLHWGGSAHNPPN
jgi:hypothetical protein